MSKASPQQPKSRALLPALTPNDERELCEVLRNSLSVVAEEQKQAEKTILEIEKRNGYLSLLLQVLSNQSVDVNSRYMACICFKNAIDKYWRPILDYPISEEEKEYLKQSLLNIALVNPDEVFSNRQFITQIALSISKITRTDYPSKWSTLVPSLGNCIVESSNNEILRNRCLVILNHFVKEQASRNLVEGKKAFRQFSSEIISFLCQLWMYYANKIYQTITTSLNEQEYNNCLICSRIIWRIITLGLSGIEKNNTVMEFFTSLHEFTAKFYTLRNEYIAMVAQRNAEINTSLLENLSNLISTFIKIPLRVQVKHDLGFRRHLLPYCQLTTKILLETDPKSPTADHKILFRSLTFLKQVTECSKYDIGGAEENQEAYNIVHNQFFTDEALQTILPCIITKYMTVATEELEKWKEDPEEFIKDQELDWSDTIKAAAEYLYLAILGTFEGRIAKFVVQFTQNMLRETYGSLDNDRIIIREACYSAVGWASYHLYSEIQFSAWYINMLRSELLPTEAFALDPRYLVIRRKCMWVLGRWVEKIDDVVRKDILSSLMTILVNTEDLVMRLTALITLKTIMSEDINMKAEDFSELLPTFMNMLLQILNLVSQEDTKLSLLSLVCVVVEKMDHMIIPYCDTLVKVLPVLWNSCDDSTMVKTQVISAISKIVRLLENNSVILYDFLIPLIQFSTDVDQPEHLYFIEEGLELWHITMQYAPEHNQKLMDLFPNLVKMLDLSLENVMAAIRLIESYSLLGKSHFLSTYGEALNQIFCNVLENAKPKAMFLCGTVIETIFTEYPVESSRLFALPVKKMIEIFLEKKERGDVRSNFTSVFSRIIFFNKNAFLEMLEIIQKEKGTPQPLFYTFLDVWMETFDAIVSSFHRKFSALALLSFYPTSNGELLNRFSQVLAISVQVLYDVDRSNELTKRLTGEDEEAELTMKNEYDRKRLLSKNDKFIQLDFCEYLRVKLNEMAQQMGPADFNTFLQQKVDPVILKQYETYQQEKK